MEEKISQIFHNCKMDCILFTNAKEIFYLTGAKFDGFWILFVKDKIYTICSKMIENQIKEFFCNQNIHICIGTSFTKTVAKTLKFNGIENLLIDPKYMNAKDFISMSEELNNEGIKITKKIGILDQIRLVKNQNEIGNIKKACQIASEVCNIIKHELREGLSELDIHYRIMELFAKNHVTESFDPIVASGKNSANPHHKSSIKKIAANDMVMIDLGCIYNGYCSDLTRTYFLGRIGTECREVWDVVKSAQDFVLKGIKAGLPVSWVDKAAVGVIEKAGYRDGFIHTTGHGVGIEIHEMPSLTSEAEGVLLAGMAVTVEPGIYIKQKFGVRIEDTILIKENDSEVLTFAAY
ncbi:MAG: M24 family metallopeptidase [Endomicrobium sp.]|jgi:Xaa-Pro aminopeptidase|nr:M24 family metallopeptidase [Endomicrobium sp.]